MPNTYTLIASSTVGAGGVSAITFSSISNTYTDLLIKVSARTAKTGQIDDYCKISFNGVSTNQSARILYGINSGTIGSTTDTSIYGPINADGTTASVFSSTEFYIPNAFGSSNKSVSIDAVEENNATDAVKYLNAGLWSSTASITSITLTPYYPVNFLQYTTAYLYGIKNS